MTSGTSRFCARIFCTGLLSIGVPAAVGAQGGVGFGISDATRARIAADVRKLDASAAQAQSMDSARQVVRDSLRIPVYYVSTRQKNPDGARIGNRFLNEPSSGAPEYGRTVVEIPKRLRAADWDDGNCARSLFGGCKEPDFSAVEVNNVNAMTVGAWREALSQSVKEDNKSLLIFVHGFNNNFVDAVTTAAQLAYDVHFTGTVATFDWTSRNSVAQYLFDKEESDRSITAFLAFLAEARATTDPSNIYIVGHSMGTRLISSAFRDEAADGIAAIYKHVVFAASDIDSTIFVNQYASKLTRKAAFATLYASARDRALMASEQVQGGPRVGSGPPAIINYTGVDYIDASVLDTDLIGHGYFRENAKLLNDIYVLFRYDARAEYRQLPMTSTARGPAYFVLRP